MTEPSGILQLLEHGTLRVIGRIPRSSNFTFLATVSPTSLATVPPTRELPDPFVPPRALDPDLFESVSPGSIAVVYKPGEGERPLWDFPDGLYRREVAAYRLSAALGWDIVPETVLRSDAPLGEGSVQKFIDADFEYHYFHLVEEEGFRDALVSIAVFDVLVNNTDRKAGHVLADHSGRIWAIDNGLAFHAEPKLRTVIWEFAGDPIPGRLVAGLRSLESGDPSLLDPLRELLSAEEVGAMVERTRRLVSVGHLPLLPSHERPYPWPVI